MGGTGTGSYDEEAPRKRLRDYILNGGIKGRYFKGEIRGDPLSPRILGIYEVINFISGDHFSDGEFWIEVRNLARIFQEEVPDTYSLTEHYLDKEATPEEVQRAKESQLAQSSKQVMSSRIGIGLVSAPWK